jgi:hypothetical protein
VIRSPGDAEEAAALFMVSLGYSDARRTQASRDGGIDVESSVAVAQVKTHMIPIGRPALQQLHGVAVAAGKKALFFSLMSYTKDAIRWADGVGMALFRFDFAGVPEPINSYARQAVSTTGFVGAPLPIGFGACVSDDRVLGAANKERSRREQLFAVHQIWLPLIAVDVFYTTTHKRHLMEHVHRVYFDALIGRRCSIPNAPLIDLGSIPNVLPAEVTADQVVREMTKAVESFRRVTQQAARQRHAAHLVQLGLPTVGHIVRTTSIPRGVLLPIAIAGYGSKFGWRAVVWELVIGLKSPDVGRLFAERLSELSPRLNDYGRRLV